MLETRKGTKSEQNNINAVAVDTNRIASVTAYEEDSNHRLKEMDLRRKHPM